MSHVLYDHTSILAMIERKWNLPTLTYRDANANDHPAAGLHQWLTAAVEYVGYIDGFPLPGYW